MSLIVRTALIAMLTIASAANAQTHGDDTPSATTPAAATPAPEVEKRRIISVTVFGDDACPADSDDAIIVCAREPEGERYRLPKELRKPKPEPTQEAWGSRVSSIEEASAASRPNSCSVVGTAGQGGCTAKMLRQWRAEQRAKKAAEREAADTAAIIAAEAE